MTEKAVSKNNHLDRCNTFSFFHIYTEEHAVNKKKLDKDDLVSH